MKIDDDGLKTLYRGYVASQTPVSRDDCPSVEQLVQTLRGSGPKKDKGRTLLYRGLSDLRNLLREKGIDYENR